MNCENVQIYLPEFIDGKLDPDNKKQIQAHLDTCVACKNMHEEFQSFMSFTDSLPDIEAPEGMKEEFLELAEMEDYNHNTRQIFPAWLKVAAAVIFTVGMFAGGYFTASTSNDSQELLAELNLMKQEVIRAELMELSGPQKIQAVYNAQELSNPGDNLIQALVYTMNSDKNINVRLAAINALTERIENQKVKDAMIESLTIQENPLLQISLIQVLAGTGDKNANEKIKSFASDKTVDENVRSHAKNVMQTII